MRKTALVFLVLLLSWTMPVGAAANMSTEMKFEALKREGIFTGVSDGSARLNDPMTREQFAAVLFRLLKLPEQGNSASFDDVLRTRWSYQEVEAVARAKLMNGVRSRVFAPGDNVTVEQLAVILIRASGLSVNSTAPVQGNVSKWARAAVRTALDRGLISQMKDYTVNATRGNLVDATYKLYEEMQVEPLRVRSVEALSNRLLKINLLQAAKEPDSTRFSLEDVFGNRVGVTVSSISQDGLTVMLWTDRQIGNTIHTLRVDGNAWTYVSLQEDATKPQIVSVVRLPNRLVEVTFSEPVESASAVNSTNYELNNGLRLTSLQLSSDQRKVTISTTDQTDGRTYRLTVKNVKDLAGNVMDTRNDLYFTGSNDNTKPKVTEVRINASNAEVSVKFSEKIDAQHAVLTYHYTVDKGLAVIQARLDSDGRTVLLKTSQQQDATVYTLTISGIPDLAGNVMDTSANWKFGGVANPIASVRLVSLRAIDQNTVEVLVSRTLSDADIGKLKLDILTDDGSNVSMTDWKWDVRRVAGNDKAVTVQFRNKSSNPDLFRSGHIYGARLSGVPGLETAGDADKAEFAGTVVANRLPYVKQAIAIGDDRVKVIFSEPVANVDETAFRISQTGGERIGIDYDELNNPDAVVTEVVLKLKDKLERGKTYTMGFNAGVIMDAPKWNGLQVADGDQPLVVNFTASW